MTQVPALKNEPLALQRGKKASAQRAREQGEAEGRRCDAPPSRDRRARALCKRRRAPRAGVVAGRVRAARAAVEALGTVDVEELGRAADALRLGRVEREAVARAGEEVRVRLESSTAREEEEDAPVLALERGGAGAAVKAVHRDGRVIERGGGEADERARGEEREEAAHREEPRARETETRIEEREEEAEARKRRRKKEAKKGARASTTQLCPSRTLHNAQYDQWHRQEGRR
mgnify:CR=1 FL=1